MVYTAQAPGCSAGNCLRWALGCVHFPGLSHSGSGSWVLHKGADSVGPVFCAAPRSEQLRQPGAWQAQSPPGAGCVLSTPPSQPLSFLSGCRHIPLRRAMCLFWGADLWLWPSQRTSTIQNPKKSWLATEPACSLVEDASLGLRLPLFGSGCPLPACLQRRIGQSTACWLFFGMRSVLGSVSGWQCLKVKVKSLSHVRLFATPWGVAYQASPSMGFSRQEYWRGLPFPSPGDLPDPGIEPVSPALEADALTSESPGKSLG